MPRGVVASPPPERLLEEYLPRRQSGSGGGALQTVGLPLGVKRHPTHGVGLKVKTRSKFLPCVLARGCLSAASPRLWPAAPGTAKLYKGEKEASDVLRTEGPGGASDRHCHLPSVLGGTRSLSIVQHVPVDELEVPSDVLHDVETHTATVNVHMTGAMTPAKKEKKKPAVYWPVQRT